MEEEVEDGSMEGLDIFFTTDKSVAEAVYYQVNSSNKESFELVIRLVYLELRGYFRLHTIWVAGTRQIAAGIDGFSRGCLTDGIASAICSSVDLGKCFLL